MIEPLAMLTDEEREAISGVGIFVTHCGGSHFEHR